MKRLFAGVVMSAAVLLLSGCYVDPGYSYVRRTSYQGDAYYGQPVSGYDAGYYAPPVYDPYYGGGYGYGCCYAPAVGVGISAAWYGRTRYYRNERPRYRRYGDGRNNRRSWRSEPSRGRTGASHGERRSGEHRTRRGRSHEH